MMITVTLHVIRSMFLRFSWSNYDIWRLLHCQQLCKTLTLSYQALFHFSYVLRAK